MSEDIRHLATVPHNARSEEELFDQLAHLVGEPLSDMWRYAGRQAFEFGCQKPFLNKKGKPTSRAENWLVVSCDWRLWEGADVLLCAADFGEERRDEQGYEFYGLLRENPPIVEHLEVEKRGELRFKLSQGYVLEIVCVDGILPHKGFLEGEQWRFVLDSEEANQLIVTADGLEFVDAEESTGIVTLSVRSRKPEKSGIPLE
jgi:hypothetical protein